MSSLPEGGIGPSTAAPPTGTVTFLFTDVEGSTKGWEAHPQQMRSALRRHDAILGDAIQAQGGYVFKTVGDAFCAAFGAPANALQAAISAQLALLAEGGAGEDDEAERGAEVEETGPLKVRMALHTGAAEGRDGDYFGQPLNRVARLLSAGHGGQVLLSAATYETVRDSLPRGVSLLDLGEHRLKDLFRPEHVYQLGTPGLPLAFPPLRTLDSRPNNLPVQPTPLIGRDKEVADVVALLEREDARLVSLTGTGGTGKTRLALQIAADMLDSFPDGVWFVELAALVEANLVVPTIAQALGVRETGSTPVLQTLNEYLKDKRLLLVVDNFEQVIDAARDVSQLLASGAGVKLLVTSRMALRVRGEREYAVPPLSVPDPRQHPTPDRLTQYEAVRLFIERAQGVKADFEVNNVNAPAVAEICVRLDGLPLAIELAAARVKMLPPQALLSRLSQRLKVLTGGARDVAARQQTLRRTIDWSYDLLSKGEKQLFRRMAVFHGGRTLEALEAVCNYDGQLELDVLEGVQSLLDKSLLQQREGSDGEPRFWMLETLHEYAREKLQESGEGEALQREHALYFMRLAEEAEPQLVGPKQVEWLDRLEDEHGNIRAALRWAGEQAEAGSDEGEDIGLRMGGAIFRFWLVRGLFREGREHLERFLSMAEVSEVPLQEHPLPAPSAQHTPGTPSSRRSSPKVRAKALNGAGALAMRQGDLSSAKSLYEAALILRRELGDKQDIAGSLNNLGLVAQTEGDYPAARALLEESLALKREVGDKRGIASSLGNLGLMAWEQGDYSAAWSLQEESLALKREVRDKEGIAASLGNLGLVAYERGDLSVAWSLQEEGLALNRELGNKDGISLALCNLGSIAREQGDYPAAHALYEESLALSRESDHKLAMSFVLHNMANIAQEQGDYHTARALYEESLALRRELGDKRSIASCLAGLARIVVGEGQVERGTRLLGAVEEVLRSTGAALDREDRLPYERSIQQARSVLGEEAFERAWQEGQVMSMEEAIAYALEEPGDE